MVTQAPFLTVHQPVHPNLHPGDGDGDRHVEQEEDGEQQGQRHPATCKEYPVVDFKTDEKEAEEGLRRTDGEVGEIFNRGREDDGSVGSAVKEHPHDLVEHPQKERHAQPLLHKRSLYGRLYGYHGKRYETNTANISIICESGNDGEEE